MLDISNLLTLANKYKIKRLSLYFDKSYLTDFPSEPDENIIARFRQYLNAFSLTEARAGQYSDRDFVIEIYL